MTFLDGERSAPQEPAAPFAAAPGPDPKPTVLESMGGPAGFVYSTIPVVVFVVGNSLATTAVAISVAMATGVVLTVVRLLRGERFASAVGGLVGVAFAAGIVALTGSAKDFFLLGIWAALAGFIAAFGSLLVRRPLTGAAWNLLHGGKHAWREDPVVLRAHDIATLAAAIVFGGRFVVKQWLYVHDFTGWLAFAKVAMGTPLTIVAVLVAAWAFRRSSGRLIREP